MELMTINRRPSALPAACAPVSGVPGLLPASAAHATVGHATVGGGLGVGVSYIQVQRAQFEGRIASTYWLMAKGKGKGSVEAVTALGDVRGVPPRGRPV
ncbi:hypothetical protein HC028_24480 [Planosporangium flavigriseum]|uniref:Uncharacterized protein n=1 Tax=Planosporangium flavigriseum TaxID=373681 RepID=A0A8J3PMQ2_9ACTN|nr:hypothetical protein [Planosporangium flavigriseum]NJC67635.1 hypothetical protein [Planosporangium flavigriseum]GIG75796.1 hypothetical protein Pfl04_42000 [Planosporangium flavigriseum]